MLTGRGEMLRNYEKSVQNSQYTHIAGSENITQNLCKDTKNISNSNTNCIACHAKDILLAEKDERIKEKNEHIDDLKKHIERSEKHINDLNKHIDTLLVEIKKPSEDVIETPDYPNTGTTIGIQQQHQKRI